MLRLRMALYARMSDTPPMDTWTEQNTDNGRRAGGGGTRVELAPQHRAFLAGVASKYPAGQNEDGDAKVSNGPLAPPPSLGTHPARNTSGRATPLHPAHAHTCFLTPPHRLWGRPQ
jgi:hypothetical protein